MSLKSVLVASTFLAGSLATAMSAHAATVLLAAGGGGGGTSSGFDGLDALIATSGESGGGTHGGAGGASGLGGDGGTQSLGGGGGFGVLGNGGDADRATGGTGAPSFLGGNGRAFGGRGGGGGGSAAGGGGGGFSGGGGGSGGTGGDLPTYGAGGGGGSYAAPTVTSVVMTAHANGSATPGQDGVNGSVEVGSVTFSNASVQTYTIPTTGEYFLEAIGGQGGGAKNSDSSGAVSGGFGALVSGDDFLTAGTVLEIVAGGGGQSGLAFPAFPVVGGGGGGGSFIFEISVGPAVPEPATWALMAVGFGALGFLGVRRGKLRSAGA
jgi:PEP-CTERM motif